MRKVEIAKAANPSGSGIPPLMPYVIQLWLLLSDNCISYLVVVSFSELKNPQLDGSHMPLAREQYKEARRK